MNILHIITAIKRGGAENHLYDLSRNQAQKGHYVTIICLKKGDYWKEKLEKDGVRVIHLNISSYLNMFAIFKLSKLIQDLKPDLVHAHLTPAELFTRLALLKRGLDDIFLIITKHNDSKFYNFIGQSLLGNWVARRANKIIAISQSVKVNNCIKNLCIPSKKISVVRYGIDPTPYEQVKKKEIDALRQEWQIDHDIYLIGVVARLIPQKSLHTLLEGFKLYQDISSSRSKLVIIGVGPLEQELKKQSIDLGIQDDIIWAGFREDIPIVMNTIDIFALTSKFEGLGLVLLEAMSAGTPVVASRISAIPEVIEDRKTGILFRPGNAQELAMAFKLLESSEERKQLSKEGIERVKSLFSLERMTIETLSLYKNMVSKKVNHHYA